MTVFVGHAKNLISNLANRKENLPSPGAGKQSKQIPAPVPPSPAKSCEGPTIDTRELYLMYNRLPADLQKQAEKSHYVCEQVLEWQRGAANRVLMARAMLMKDMVEGLELAPHLEAMDELPAVQAYRALFISSIKLLHAIAVKPRAFSSTRRPTSLTTSAEMRCAMRNGMWPC